MEQHRRWTVPAVAALLLLVLGLGGSALLWSLPAVRQSFPGVLFALLLPPVTIAAAVVLIVRAVQEARSAHGEHRRSQGRFTAVELAQRASADEGHRAWAAARELRAGLARREVPPALQVWDVVPEPGEVFFYDLTVDHERWYGQVVAYPQGGGLYLGPPAFVLAGLALSSVVRSNARRTAEARAAVQWRDQERVRVLVSNTRLVCLVRGEWVSFAYSAMSAVHPEVSEWTLVCQFHGPAAPLRLRGNGVPLIAVLAVFATHGLDAVVAHPSLAALGAVTSSGPASRSRSTDVSGATD
ncbi:hypothetical protein [Frigoribacterium salinisoli]